MAIETAYPLWAALLIESCLVIPDVYESCTLHNYTECNLVAASSTLHEVKHPRIVPPPGHPPGGGTITIEYVPVVIYFWQIEVCGMIPDVDEFSIA